MTLLQAIFVFSVCDRDIWFLSGLYVQLCMKHDYVVLSASRVFPAIKDYITTFPEKKKKSAITLFLFCCQDLKA